jgi:hypothetical protein
VEGELVSSYEKLIGDSGPGAKGKNHLKYWKIKNPNRINPRKPYPHTQNAVTPSLKLIVG